MPDIKKSWFIIILLAVLLTLACVLITIFSLKNGILEIYPYLYLVPVILIAYASPRTGVYFTILLGWLFLGLVYLYGVLDLRLVASSTAWFYIFVSLGVLISAYMNEIVKQRKYHDIFVNSQSGIFTFDLETLKIQQHNLRLDHILGYGEGELDNREISTIWDLPDEMNAILFRVRSGSPVSDAETSFVKKDGNRIWGQVTVSRSMENLVVCSVADISERKRAEAQIRERELRFRMTGDLIPYGVWISDASGQFTYCSESFLVLLDMKQEECGNFAWMKRLTPEDAERTKNDWIETVRTGGFWDYEYRIFDKAHGEHFVLSRGSPLRDGTGKIISFVGIHLDITDLKLAEESLKTSLVEKNILLREIHHRVKNNMQLVIGLLQFQASAVSSPEIARIVLDTETRIRSMVIIHERLYRSDDLINIPLESYLRDLIDNLIYTYRTKTIIKVEYNIENIKIDQPTLIHLGLLITEVVSNSLNHAFPNRDTGTITLSFHREENNDMTLSIHDDGIGIPDACIQEKPVAMGLQLIYLLGRDQLNGSILIEGNNGTTFTFTFNPALQVEV